MNYPLNPSSILLEKELLLKTVSRFLDKSPFREFESDISDLISGDILKQKLPLLELHKENMTPDMQLVYQERLSFLEKMYNQKKELSAELSKLAIGTDWNSQRVDKIAEELDTLNENISIYEWYFMNSMEKLEWVLTAYFWKKKSVD